MGVQLNIKDETVVRLARELADADGKSVTQTLRDLLEREHRERAEEEEQRSRRVWKLLDEIQAHWTPEALGMSSKEMMDSIYDEDGLPI